MRRRLAVAKPNWVDRAIGVFSPGMATQRLRDRSVLNYFASAGRGGYLGARTDRAAGKSWAPGGGSADGDLLPDLEALRERSRDLVRNMPLAAGAISNVVTATVGTGLQMRARIDAEVLGISQDAADAWEKQAEREFDAWACSPDADVTRTQTFEAMQGTALRSTLESGDLFVVKRFVERPGRGFGLCLQLIEGDRVSNPGRASDRPDLAGGVEMDANGAPLAYWMLDQHPGSLSVVSPKWIRVPAFGERSGRRQVYHLFDRLRPEQNRGVPYLAPVVEALKQLGRYTDAELMAAVVNSVFAIGVETPAEDGYDPLANATQAGDTASDKDEVRIDQAGMVVTLAPGEKIESFKSERPSGQFDGFVNAFCRHIGVALQQPYEVLVKRFDSSYSASRAALMEAWRFFLVRRAWLVSSLCQPVYEDVLAEAVARGRIDAPGFWGSYDMRRAWCGAEWVGPAMGQLNPVDEVQAAILKVNAGLSTLEAETASLTGGDYDRNHEQLVRETKRRNADGLIAAPNLPVQITVPPKPGQPQLPQPARA